MITAKQFILIIIASFVLGIGVGLLVYHCNVKDDVGIEVVDSVNDKLKYSRDSLLTEVKIKELMVFELKRQLIEDNVLIDSLIEKNHKNGKVENSKIKGFNSAKLNYWNDSILRANKLK